MHNQLEVNILCRLDILISYITAIFSAIWMSLLSNQSAATIFIVMQKYIRSLLILTSTDSVSKISISTYLWKQ